MVTYLLGTFGMYEMEQAAEQIVSLAIAKKDWNIWVSYDQIEDKAGFLQFRVTEEFCKRVIPKYGALVDGLAPILLSVELYARDTKTYSSSALF